MKKNLKITIISLSTILIVFFFVPNELSQSRSYNKCYGFEIKHVCFGIIKYGTNNIIRSKINFLKSPTKFCGTEGMSIPTMAESCCEGFSEMWNTCPENDCECENSYPSLGGLGICSNCGNGICERNNNENHCNCPEDCDVPLYGSQNLQ